MSSIECLLYTTEEIHVRGETDHCHANLCSRCLQLLAEVNSDLGRSDEAMSNLLEDFDLCRKHHMPLHRTSLLFNRILVSN